MIKFKIYPVTPPFLNIRDYFSLIKNIFNAHYSDVKILEKKLAGELEGKYAIITSSARAAIMVILLALEKDDKNEILLPAYTCIVVPDAVVSAGYVPRFVDVDKTTGNPSLENYQKEYSYKTKAIILTHMFGNMTQVEKIVNWAKKNKIFIIEDACLAFGGTYKGKKSGSFGDSSVISFNTGKPITSFGGGLISTNSFLLYNKFKNILRSITSPLPIRKRFSLYISIFVGPLLFNPFIYQITVKLPKLLPFLRKFQNPISIEKKEQVVSYTVDKLQLSLISSQISRFRSIIIRRHKLFGIYNKIFSGKKCLIPFNHEKDTYLSPSHYSLIISDTGKKEMLILKALEQGVRIGDVFDYVCPLTPAYGITNRFPKSVYLSKHIVNIPFYPDLDEKKALEIGEIIVKIMESR
jgi:dTDP-4-amino-4,6-dideoxygalactose transaminase